MSKQKAIRNLLVLVDGTDSSSRALDLAIELCRNLRAQLTALAFVETETLRQLLSVHILTAEEMVEFEEGLSDSADRHLREARERALRRSLEIECVTVEGNSEVEVPRVVQERDVDLIVVGHYDCGRAQRELIARQRQQLVDHAPCPVLVAR